MGSCNIVTVYELECVDNMSPLHPVDRFRIQFNFLPKITSALSRAERLLALPLSIHSSRVEKRHECFGQEARLDKLH